MAKRSVNLPLSRMTDGVNTFSAEAGDDQTVDAIDVIEDGGDLVRRPVFRPVAHGPFYLLPAGKVTLVHEYPLLTFTVLTNRLYAEAVDRIGGLNGRLWVGCDEKFDGIDYHTVALLPSNLTAHRRIAVLFNGSAQNNVRTLAHGVVDTTRARVGDYYQPLMQDGYIHWHKEQHEDTWGFGYIHSSTTVGGQKYWVALDCTASIPEESATSVTAAALTGTGDLQFTRPGIRAFITSPINGLYACKLRNSAPVLIAGADAKPQRGREGGAAIGYIRNLQCPIDPAVLVDFEGAGLIDQITTPAWSHVGAATGTEGAADTLTKTDQSYSWRTNSLEGSTLASFAAQAASTTTAVNTPVSLGITSASPYENHRLICTAKGAGGTPVGEEREIYSTGTNVINVYDAFSIAPDTDNTFEIRTRANYVRTREGHPKLHEIASNTAHAALLVTGRPYNPLTSSPEFGRYVHYEIVREVNWVHEAGRAWSYVYNAVTGKVLMCNGNGPILEFDGIRTRQLTTLHDSTDGVPGAALVQEWTAAVDEVAATLGVQRVPSFLRKSPPIGKYLADFKSHIVVAGLKDRENVIQWSAPNVFNAIWPSEYETQVRDAENSAITGLWSLGDQLIVSTVTGLFASDPPDANGMLSFRPVSQGMGFVSQNATVRVPLNGTQVLMGPTSDGIRAFTGGSPIEILDRWDRVIKEGVNARRLSGSVGAVSLTDTVYFLAVPSAGSRTNDRLLAYDWSGKKIWLWSVPFGGISFIARDISENGRETILFGHEDGTISVLGPGDRDGAETVTGRARSKPIRFDGQTAAFTGLLVTASDTGTNTITLRTFVDDGESNVQEASFSINQGAPVYGTGLYNTSAVSQERLKTVRLNLRAGGTDSVGVGVQDHHGTSFQYEIESAKRFRLRGVTLIASIKGQRHAT